MQKLLDLFALSTTATQSQRNQVSDKTILRILNLQSLIVKRQYIQSHISKQIVQLN